MDTLQQSLTEHGYVVFDLRDRMNEALTQLEQAAEAAPLEDWTQVINNNGRVQDLALNDPVLVKEHALARDRLFAGEFAYSFKRIDCAGEARSAASEQVRSFLRSTLFTSMLADRFGSVVTGGEAVYINKFEEGDFLTTHCDRGADIAVVISLTRDWDMNYGGLTFILSQDRTRILRTISPSFGEAVIFDTKGKPTPHFVSMVCAPRGRGRSSLVARLHIERIKQ
ncbi:hypothetical protein OOT46_29305 [Aquabacterium sp. A7-Y]|uniref:2OG-Fe(II) oxygenase family protein n=1 Tax=Aquabacterium sp. A7-Y TaxID=1349605 RepID=UPI00223E1948|nr:2OG-Fe(II) oxygenase family protein [Aquabacterium sp. A7-Y]MCW7541899.1 hypothetical protein [Aquabacterium sp. A7-Y]